MEVKKKEIEIKEGGKGLLFPIVGIGASAGGLEALTGLLTNLSIDTGMAFVIVQHLDRMKVIQITNGIEIKPNHIYIVPPNADLFMENKVLKLEARREIRGLHMPIDHFFRSLTKNQGSQAVGIILSGTGSDGALGLLDIKENGGITFVQDEKTAQFAGMPQSAIATGAVDFVLTLENIAKELNRVASHPYITSTTSVSKEEASLPPLSKPLIYSDKLAVILRLLRKSTGVDFSYYKINTIFRRISRRMVLRKMEQLEEYFEYLKKNPEELDALFHDLLIKVTSFFRDPETFEAIKQAAIPKILEHHQDDKSIRIWVPACASGEEVYSLAICLLECLGNKAGDMSIRIFATDIDDLAIQKARAGFYIENIAQDVSPQRLQRFFTKHDNNYRINKSIRDMCTFARHDLCKDPPFSNVDLISCKNVMIYFEQSMQKRIIPIFHYALNPEGFLALGTAESIGTFSELFTVVDKKNMIYAKALGSPSKPIDFFFSKPQLEEIKNVSRDNEKDEPLSKEANFYKEADRVLLHQYAPASVLINEQMEILQFRGDTSRFLLPAPGKASLNLLRMAREGLPFEIKAGIDLVKKSGVPVSRKNIRLKYEGKLLNVNLKVIPLMPATSDHFLVLFEESLLASGTSEVPTKQEVENEENHLRQELDASKQYAQSIIESQEASTEELKSANEEILSSNEELQSTNEELETAREELQSSNEELNTINEELHQRNIEVSQANNDLNNLFSSANLPIIMIGRDLRIRWITQMAQKVLNVIPSDIGRSLEDLKLNIHIPKLESLLLSVIEKGVVKEWQVQDRQNQWYSVQIRPYKTTEGRTDGAVLFFINIDSLKGVESLTRTLEELKISQKYSAGIVQTVREPLLILDDHLCVISANPSFYRFFQTSKEETEHQSIYSLGNGHWEIPKMRKLLEQVFLKNEDFENFEIEHDFLHIGHKTMCINARRITLDGNGTETILLSIEDITQRKLAEEKIKSSLREKDILLKEIHHRVKNNLQIISSLLKLKDESIKDKRAIQFVKESQERIRAISLVHEKLYASQDLSHIDMKDYIKSLVGQLLGTAARPRHIDFKIQSKDVSLGVDVAIPCGLILNELVSNIIKHAFPEKKNGRVLIELKVESKNNLMLVVEDNGQGIPSGLDISKTKSLGLSLVGQLVDQIEGHMDLERSAGRTKFIIRFPYNREGSEGHE
jgi:two-component system, chemotaxis family, CheB/CheR fusion protein